MADTTEQFEYKRITMKGDFMVCINKAGEQGWQFCVAMEQTEDATIALFMRKKAAVITDLRGAPVNLRARD